VIVALTAAAGAMRAVRLGDPMRYDEAFSFLFFVSRSDPAACFNYLAPNNHILHTIAVLASTVVGGIGPVAIRFPAFLAGLALVPASAELARRLVGRPLAGVFAAILVGGSGILIEYSANARGYSMVCLACLLLTILSLRLSQTPERRRTWVAWAVTAALGTFTIPIMLYPVAICCILLILQGLLRKTDKPDRHLVARRLFHALAAAAALSLLLYVPVFLVSGARKVLANEYVTPKTFSKVASELPGVIAATLWHWGRDTSWLWRILIAAGLAWSAVLAIRRRDIFLAIPFVTAPLLILAAVLHRVVPFPRVWLFLLPLVLVAAAAGLDDLAGRLRPRRVPWLASIAVGAAVAIAAGDAGRRTRERPYLMSEDPGNYILVESENVVRDAAELADGHTAITWNWNVPYWPPLAYYAVLHSPPDRPFADVTAEACRRVLIVVDDRHEVTAALDANPYVKRHFSQPKIVRTYSRAKVYMATRTSPP